MGGWFMCFLSFVPVAPQQEMLTPFFQEEGMELVMSLLKHKDLGVLFFALEYVSRLLAHKKVALAFVQGGGVEVLLRITKYDQVRQQEEVEES